MFEKIYELPINREYVRHWGMVEAVRELIQNALDSQSPFQWEFDGDTLRITSKFATLTPSSLLLGTTTKAEDGDAIGSFGEGYKIAMLVLTRDEYSVTIYNGNVVWSPEFRLNKKFGAETLHIIETAATESNSGVTFEVSGLTHSDMDEIKQSCLLMQDFIGEFKLTRYGEILLEQKGRLYVGGLYICDTDMDYGYNIKPEYLKLERDRQTVNSFDLTLRTKDMWFDINDPDRVAELMEADCPDLYRADWGTPDVVEAACYKLFQEKHPNAIIADSNDELKRMVAKGMTNTVYLGGRSFGSAVKSSYGYTSTEKSVLVKASPHNELEEFYENNKKYMKRAAQVLFKKLIEVSKHWVNK